MSCPFLLNYEITSLGELNKTTQNREVADFQTKIHAFCFQDRSRELCMAVVLYGLWLTMYSYMCHS